MSSTINHMTAVEKTTAILVLAEALQAATLVGDPAPRVASLRDWMALFAANSRRRFRIRSRAAQ